MSTALHTLFANLASVASIVFAGLLALKDAKAWVWIVFLVAAVLLHTSVSTTTIKKTA